MTFRQFRALVARHGWTLPQLRCDVPPPADMLDAIDAVGEVAWVRFTMRLEKESEAGRRYYLVRLTLKSGKRICRTLLATPLEADRWVAALPHAGGVREYTVEPAPKPTTVHN